MGVIKSASLNLWDFQETCQEALSKISLTGLVEVQKGKLSKICRRFIYLRYHMEEIMETRFINKMRILLITKANTVKDNSQEMDHQCTTTSKRMRQIFLLIQPYL